MGGDRIEESVGGFRIGRWKTMLSQIPAGWLVIHLSQNGRSGGHPAMSKTWQHGGCLAFLRRPCSRDDFGGQGMRFLSWASVTPAAGFQQRVLRDRSSNSVVILHAVASFLFIALSLVSTSTRLVCRDVSHFYPTMSFPK